MTAVSPAPVPGSWQDPAPFPCAESIPSCPGRLQACQQPESRGVEKCHPVCSKNLASGRDHLEKPRERAQAQQDMRGLVRIANPTQILSFPGVYLQVQGFFNVHGYNRVQNQRKVYDGRYSSSFLYTVIKVTQGQDPASFKSFDNALVAIKILM